MDIELRLTNAEVERFQHYAKIHGLSSVEEAIEHAALAQLEGRYKLPSSTASILNFEALKKADKGNQDG